MTEQSPQFADFWIEGEYQDGETSKSVPARLRVHMAGCELTAGDLRLDLPPADIELTDRISNTPRRINWGGDACFVTKDNDAADRLRRLLPGGELGRLAFKMEKNLALALASLVVVVGLLGSFMIWGVPAGARYVANQIPDNVRTNLAERTMESLDEAYFGPSELSEERRYDLKRYFRSVDDHPEKIFFRDGQSIGANAMALPGGYVVFTDQIVELAEHDDELLGVYLHEVGHSRFRHAEAMVLQSSMWLVTLSLITGDVSGASELLLSIPVALGQAAFSRDLERDADGFAIEEMLAAKKSPSYLADLLQRLSSSRSFGDEDCDKKEGADAEEIVAEDRSGEDCNNSKEGRSGLFEYVSSHPATNERLQRIHAAADAQRDR